MILQKFLFRGHLDEGEQLLFVAHKHWFLILFPLLKFFFLGILFPWMIWLFVDFSFWWMAFWHLGFIAWFLYETMDWYLDALLVTNASVIDIAWHGLFYRTSSRVDYADLKEITYEVNGIMATLLDFGILNVHLNSGKEISLENVTDPKNVELVIKGYKQKFLHAQKMTDSATIQEILSDIVQHHIAENGLPQKKYPPSQRGIGHKTF